MSPSRFPEALAPLPMAALLAVLLLVGACAAGASTIPGTRIPDNKFNRDVIGTVEAYRMAVERRDAAALMLMASPQYREDSGTPTGSDDYGYDGLRDVLAGRFQQASDVRFTLHYLNIRKTCASTDEDDYGGCIAYVQVQIDASFSLVDSRGQERRPDMRDRNELVLEWSDADTKWKFRSGM